eukprot:1187764-Prorocentrum_minimum.AAC.1
MSSRSEAGARRLRRVDRCPGAELNTVPYVFNLPAGRVSFVSCPAGYPAQAEWARGERVYP